MPSRLTLTAAIAASAPVSWVLQHFGNLSPYQKAPMPPNVQESLPSDCVAEQVFYIGRHGSHYPSAAELASIRRFADKLEPVTQSIQSAKLRSDVNFLKSGYNTTLGVDHLTVPGRQQLFEHGTQFRLKYPHLSIDEILTGAADHVVESAQWWRLGYFGRDWEQVSTLTRVPENGETISFITPLTLCPKWNEKRGPDGAGTWRSAYRPHVVARMKRLIPSAKWTAADIRGALAACAYDAAAYGADASPWCGVFSEDDILKWEHELGLLMNSAFGPGLSKNMGATLGSLAINKIIEVFTKSSDSLVSFGYDITMHFILTALGLAKDTSKPPIIPQGRKPDTSKTLSSQVPFGAQMVFEKFTCEDSVEGPQIRLILNEAPVPMTCAKSSFDKRFGSCSLRNFIRANAASTAIKWGDGKWKAACGCTEARSSPAAPASATSVDRIPDPREDRCSYTTDPNDVEVPSDTEIPDNAGLPGNTELPGDAELPGGVELPADAEAQDDIWRDISHQAPAWTNSD